MSRFFRRKKDKDEGTAEDEPVEGTEAEIIEEEETAEEQEMDVEEVVEDDTEAAPVGREETIPYHSEIKERLMYMFNDSNIGAGIEGTDEFYIEFMAMGERFWIGKAPLGDIESKSGAMTDQDAHIRVSNDVVADLLSAATFSEFSKIYIKYYKNAEAGKFVKIEVRKPITDLNRRGYARVPVLKLLIGSAR
ncbi:hypothetical protein EU527_05045 [Candidatus Thorarchaeota archaeon]|nr:MAG: hypothetical protein EU527_05045 [Candidatus Thorarchaeota archaeon]